MKLCIHCNSTRGIHSQMGYCPGDRNTRFTEQKQLDEQSRQELMVKKLCSLPPDYVTELADFVSKAVHADLPTTNKQWELYRWLILAKQKSTQ